MVKNKGSIRAVGDKLRSDVTCDKRGQGMAMKGLIAIAIVFALVAIGLIGAAVVSDRLQLTAVAAQDDSDLLEEEKDTQPAMTYASTQVIDIVSLIGQGKSSVAGAIGHGAVLQSGDSLDSLGFSAEDVFELSDEKGDALSGTPTVTVGYDGKGKVAAVSYQVSTAALGYGELSFSDAVTNYCIVENVLRKAGLTSVENGSAHLPDESEYSTYESDRVTLSSEKYTFRGTAAVDKQKYSWDVTLDYDYTEANKTGNLANTVKKITVAVMKV